MSFQNRLEIQLTDEFPGGVECGQGGAYYLYANAEAVHTMDAVVPSSNDVAFGFSAWSG